MEDALAAAVRAALAALPDLPADFDADAVEVEFQTPNDASHGDLATNVALQLARPLRRSPRAIADAIAASIEVDPQRVQAVEVAGPGFLNIRFADAHLTSGLADLLKQGARFGRSDAHAGESAIVEYVSANPTGPLTVGHGRNAVLGDTVANLLGAVGYDVTREYYFNDAGRQMRMLGQSVRARYQQALDADTPTRTLGDGLVVPESFPDDGYRGEYIATIAQSLAADEGHALLDAADEAPFTEAAKAAIFAEIEATLARLGIRHDSQFNERTLFDAPSDGGPAPVWDAVQRLRDAGLVYDQDDAVWFKTSALGKTEATDAGEVGKDVVLVKSSGEPTYRLPDIAYHLDKLARGFDLVLDVFGADHIATYPDVVRGVRAIAGDEAAAKIEVLVYQFVTLVRGGEPVKMSTRKATYETLDDLMDEVNAVLAERKAEAQRGADAAGDLAESPHLGTEADEVEAGEAEAGAPADSADAGSDVVRFFFLMRSSSTHLEFDLDLATQASDKNPVFYLQYAHARAASIERKARQAGVGGEPDLGLLTHPAEQALTKALLQFPDDVRAAAEARAPHRLATSLRELASAFNAFYRDCRIVGEAPAMAQARLALTTAARTVLANGLTILGLDAPERM